jgi:hypothetical protein
VINKLLVSRYILSGTKIGRGEDLAVRLDLDVVTRADPRFPGSIRKLTSFRSTSVRELVGSIVECHKNSGTGPIDGNKRSYLVTSGSSNQSSLLGPNSNHGSYSPVVVNNGRSIKGIPTNSKLSTSLLVSVTNLRIFLRSSLANHGRVLASLPHEIISNYIDRKLSITKGIGASFNSHKGSPQGLCDISTCIKHIFDNSTGLLISALCVKHLIERVIRILLLSISVKGSGRGSILSVKLSRLGGYWTKSGRREGSSTADEEEI